jgi:hypothetical protein
MIAILGALAAGGCRHRPGADAVMATSEAAVVPARSHRVTRKPLRLVDATEQAGIRFRHSTGAFGQKWFPETNGSGAVFFDFDGDGHPDLFLVNGREWTETERQLARLPPARSDHRRTGRLYRNRGDGTFDDATSGSGLDVEIYGMGATAGDYDNDGRTDLFVTGIGRSELFRNEGGGHFRKVTEAAGLKDRGWSSSAAWVDVDRDGYLDLFVCHYVRWSPSSDQACFDRGKRVYCAPDIYPPESCRLYHNRRDGTFEDISARAGILRRRDGRALLSKALGVAVGDFDGDGWPDLAVANDQEANFLFRNNGDGTFTEEGQERGIAFSSQGEARSGMGIDAGVWSGNGREGLLIGNFVEEKLGLYENDGLALFTDLALRTGVGTASEPYTTFGCLLVDLDNDGWLDIVAANGHIDYDFLGEQDKVPYAQRPLFLRNESGREFRTFAGFDRAMVGRGLAAADIDGDGDVDLLITTNGGAPALLRNEGGEQRRSLRISLKGVKSNRDGIGAEVTAWIGPRVVRRRVRSGSSYLSQSELPLTLGLGEARQADRLRVTWPSGAKDFLVRVPAGANLTIHEGQSPDRTAPDRSHARSARASLPTSPIPLGATSRQAR